MGKLLYIPSMEYQPQSTRMNLQHNAHREKKKQNMEYHYTKFKHKQIWRIPLRDAYKEVKLREKSKEMFMKVRLEVTKWEGRVLWSG